ncbi:snurportin-1-like [Littorina saxatilis]|uniref:Snurportin-1 n=1 Tax=Littorina saxatilis TaxID=31220 RepID=A0AAN9C2F2_9CAEN
MATKSEVGDLADKVAKGLKLDSGGPLLDMEELVYKATPAELESLRKQVLQKQTLSGFDDEGLVKRFVNATKPKEAENGSGDKSSFFNCFQNQIMLPTVLDSNDQLPGDLQKNWLCIVCPQGTRVLVIASHKSTRVYDLEGTWICEHDTHLPGGSPSPVSQVDDENECTILDCLYDNEQEIYYAVDLLCWKGLRYYKYEASVRLATLLEKLKDVPTLKGITQTNPVS